jgi:LemA protein
MSLFWILLIVIVLLAIYIVGIYNRLVSLRQNVMNSWSQIDVQLKRRYDLIPNLIETVKAYMKYEQETLQQVIEARNKALGATTVHDKALAENQVSAALSRLFALSESYPELKANQNMLSLQEELKSTENKIAFARQYYNDIVTLYNTKLESFPDSFIAGFGNFKPSELFELEEVEARKAPKISFD